jgi:glycosyltransferase involved in cell wall biosynthesis
VRVYVDLEGTGVGARKQYELLKQTRPHLFVGSEGAADIVCYWQAFTRNFAKLDARKHNGKKIVCRVGGFHPENELTTWRMLKAADGAIFVANWQMEHLKTCQRVAGEIKTWRLPPKRRVIPNGSTWIGWRESDVDYLLIRCAKLGNIRFKRGLNRAYSIWAMAQIWDKVRVRYPGLNLWILGDYDRSMKKDYLLPGWKWLGFQKNTRWYGQGAIALVHLVSGDFGPNTVAEALGEGIPAIVPNVGGAFELAGDAGCIARFGLTDKRKFPESECGGHFYQIDKASLFNAVCDVMDNRMKWRSRVGDWWQRRVNIQRVADGYENFFDNL